MIYRFVFLMVLLNILGCFPVKQPSETILPEPAKEDTTYSQYIQFKSTSGSLRFRFFKDTPLHRNAFLMQFQDSLATIQLTENVPNLLLRGIVKSNNKGTFLAPEITRKYANTRGNLCATLSKNGISDVSSFYIVTGGVPFSETVLADFATQVRLQSRTSDFYFSKKNKALYQKYGGAPWLDMQYTCFAELVKGINTLETLSRLKTKGNSAGKARYAFKNPKFAELRTREM